MQFIDRLTGVVGLAILSATTIGVLASPLAAQSKVPLVGTVAPGAIGAPAPTAVPIGGLQTHPLSGGGTDGRNQTVGSAPTRDRSGGNVYRDRYGQYYVPIADAPSGHHGVVLTYRDGNALVAGNASGANRWTPTTAKPRWVVDTSRQAVDAWRDIIVTDEVCRFDGTCAERQQRLRAGWIAGCRCYAFFDAWNRLWRVE